MTNQTPAEALQGKYMTSIKDCLDYMEKYKDRSLAELHLNHLFTSYAATVEREGRINELNDIHTVIWANSKEGLDIDYARPIQYLDARLAALQGPIQGDSK